ncbi:MAG: hypothetical protein ACKPJD_16140, partial [Planctomycetaceae bacterium]
MARKTTISSMDDDNDPASGQGSWDGSVSRGSGGSAEGGGDQERLDDELRPSRLQDVVGQRDVVERLMILLEATKK